MNKIIFLTLLSVFISNFAFSSSEKKMNEKNALYLLEKESYNLDFKDVFQVSDSIVEIIELYLNIDSLKENPSRNLFNYYALKFAQSLNNKENFEKSLFYLNSMKLISNRMESDFLYAKYQIYKSFFFLKQIQYAEAVKSLNISLDILESKYADSLLFPELYLKLSDLYTYRLDDYEQAQLYANSAFQVLEVLRPNCSCVQIKALNYLSINYLLDNNHDSAISTLNRTRKYINDFAKKACSSYIIKYFDNEARLNIALKNYDLALQYCDSALSILNINENLYQRSHILTLKGHIYFIQNDFESSLKYNRKVKHIRIINGSADDNILSSYINIAIDYYYLKDFKKSLEILDSALLFHNKNNSIYSARLYYYKSLNYDSLGDIEKAYSFFKLYKTYDDSLSQTKNISKINYLTYNKELLEKESQIQALSLNRQKNRSIFYLLISGFFILIAFFLGYIYFINRKQNKKLLATNKIIKKSKAELQIAKNKAEESDKLKSEFLANMSHDIRTPLNGIVGFSSLVFDKNLSEKERQVFAKIVIQNSKLLLRLIDDILEFSRIESNGLEFSFNNFKLKSAIEQSIDNNQIMAIEKGLSIEANGYENIDIVNDNVRLQQVMNNLIGNAIKYSEKGKISISCKQLDNNQIQVDVKDNGIGIDKEEIEYIFDKFRRGKHFEKTGKSISGTGLGLAITKRIVEGMGGKIWVQSEESNGSSFSFTLNKNMNLEK